MDMKTEQLVEKHDWNEYMALDAAVADRPGRENGPIRCVAFFCPNLRTGGIARVVGIVAGLLADKGYKVIVCTHEDANGSVMALPDGVLHVSLPRERLARLDAIDRVMEREKVDLCVFNERWTEETFYLTRFAKLLGRRVAVIIHSSFFHLLYEGNFDLFNERFSIFTDIDALCCLTESDAHLWRTYGVDRAVCVHNPLTFRPDSVRPSAGTSGNILFVGRMSKEKGSEFLPGVIKEVSLSEPEARLVIVGDFESRRIRSYFRREARRLGVEDRIDVTGLVDDVAPYFRDAAALVMTSMYEGHPMVRMEAAAHGMPCVLFSMPYLEPPPERFGCVMVGKRDVAGMAEAIVRLIPIPFNYY